MTKLMRLGLALAWLWAAVEPARAADSLVWRSKENRVDADIQAWTLQKLLQNLSAATGWKVYIEPNVDHRVSTRFHDLPAAEALNRLLGNLSFALLPQTNGPARLLIYKSSLQGATLLIAPPKGTQAAGKGKPIPNELIVTLKPGDKGRIDELAKQLGAKVVGRADGLNSYRLQFTDEASASAARTALSDNEEVAGVDSNYSVFHPPTAQPLSFASAPPLSLKPSAPNASGNLIIGLVDTPVQNQAASLNGFLLPALSVTGQNPAPSADITHGTSMAETILQGYSMAAPGAKTVPIQIQPVDVYGASETTTTFDVANGIYTAAKAGANIINLSLGSEGDSTFLHTLIQQGVQQGILFVAAAGNQPTTAPTYPAAYPEVLSVTAGDRNGNVASYANRGSFVDVIAPGSSIVSLGDQSYLGLGTSFSTAYVSGLASALANQPGNTLAKVPAEIRQMIGFTPPPPGKTGN